MKTLMCCRCGEMKQKRPGPPPKVFVCAECGSAALDRLLEQAKAPAASKTPREHSPL